LIRVSRRDEEASTFQRLPALVDGLQKTDGHQGTTCCAPTPPTHCSPELRCLALGDLPHGARAVTASQMRRPLGRPLCPLFSSHAPPHWSTRQDKSHRATCQLHSVPWAQFQVLLTRLSAFFSTFARATSPLSVFVLYLDLGEVYLLLCAALTSNTTLRHREIWLLHQGSRGSHPLWRGFPTDFTSTLQLLPRAQKEHRQRLITVPPPFSFDLFPLRSPLLWESLLFSFPPLNNKLKFSG